MKLRQRTYAAATERRVTAISYIAGNIKGVRMLGLSTTILNLLTKLREVEIAALAYIWKLLVWIFLLSNITFQLSTVSTYATFAVMMLVKDSETELSFNRLYGSLSALKLVASPLMTLLQAIPVFQVSYASLERLQTFLEDDLMSHGLSMTVSSLVVRGTELKPLASAHLQDLAISLEKANFAIDGNHLLFDLTTHCHPATLTIVVGKVGSGKSVFLRSLVGEAEHLSGRFTYSSTGSAFCDQQVWLRNATIRENIVEESMFDEACYKEILWSCGLLQDLQEMKEADYTLIGSKGMILSGGQKNRVSLARALYARKPVSIIDDMLAGLDNTTEKLVFDRVFGRHGFFRKRNATVVLATHAIHYARHADKVVIISDGRIVGDGRYQDLTKTNILEELQSDAIQENSDKTMSEGSISTSKAPVELAGPESQIVGPEEQDQSRKNGDRRSFFYFVESVGPRHMGK
jgi:ATP-binding cassette subfamily C (CFTR/MRP) protein 1